MLIRSQNVRMNELTLEDVAYVTHEIDAGMNRSRVRRGDVLLNITGASIGRVASFELENVRANVNQHVCIIRPKPNALLSRYATHLISSREFQGEIDRLQHGGTRQALTFSQIAEFKIPLPPLAEQRRIAAVLDAAEALRAKRRAALAQLDTLTQAIFIEMFGDPVTNSRGWPLKKFREIGSLDRGVSTNRPRNAPELLGGAYPLIQTGEIANSDGYVRGYTSTYSEAGLKQSKMWPAGTLCITIAANIAKTGILTFPACFPDSIVGFRAENPATVQFVRVWLSFLQKTLEENAPESAQKNINLGMLRELLVPCPPIEDREEFARRVTALEKLKATQRAALTQLNALFASLQHRAFRGEL